MHSDRGYDIYSVLPILSHHSFFDASKAFDAALYAYLAAAASNARYAAVVVGRTALFLLDKFNAVLKSKGKLASVHLLNSLAAIFCNFAPSTEDMKQGIYELSKIDCRYSIKLFTFDIHILFITTF